MKRLKLLPALLLALLFVWTPSLTLLVTPVSAAQAERERKEITVWVNTRTGVYHCPGSRWYGNTKQGRYMGECEARRAGYWPARDRPCGSSCQ